jgi:hypothetical protein
VAAAWQPRGVGGGGDDMVVIVLRHRRRHHAPPFHSGDVVSGELSYRRAVVRSLMEHWGGRLGRCNNPPRAAVVVVVVVDLRLVGIIIPS